MRVLQVAEATNVQLDWLVTKCEGAMPQISWDKRLYGAIGDTFDYTTDWAQGGQIIERERMHLEPWGHQPGWLAFTSDRYSSVSYTCQEGETALIAAMRCFVYPRLGAEVGVPDGLV